MGCIERRRPGPAQPVATRSRPRRFDGLPPLQIEDHDADDDRGDVVQKTLEQHLVWLNRRGDSRERTREIQHAGQKEVGGWRELIRSICGSAWYRGCGVSIAEARSSCSIQIAVGSLLAAATIAQSNHVRVSAAVQALEFRIARGL
jgi:hypothetical protein